MLKTTFAFFVAPKPGEFALSPDFIPEVMRADAEFKAAGVSLDEEDIVQALATAYHHHYSLAAFKVDLANLLATKKRLAEEQKPLALPGGGAREKAHATA